MYAASPYLPPHLQAAIRHPSMAELLRHPFAAAASTSKALELLQQHATQFYNSQHKIHELQERALKSPNSAAVAAAAAVAASRPPSALGARGTPPPPTFTTAPISSPATSAAAASAIAALAVSKPSTLP